MATPQSQVYLMKQELTVQLHVQSLELQLNQTAHVKSFQPLSMVSGESLRTDQRYENQTSHRLSFYRCSRCSLPKIKCSLEKCLDVCLAENIFPADHAPEWKV